MWKNDAIWPENGRVLAGWWQLLNEGRSGEKMTLLGAFLPLMWKMAQFWRKNGAFSAANWQQFGILPYTRQTYRTTVELSLLMFRIDFLLFFASSPTKTKYLIVYNCCLSFMCVELTVSASVCCSLFSASLLPAYSSTVLCICVDVHYLSCLCVY